MSQVPDSHQLNTECREDLRIEWKIAFPSILLAVVVAGLCFLFPTQSGNLVSALYSYCASAFGSPLLLFNVVLIGIALYFTFSKYGDIKFGDPDEKPEFSTASWMSMVFCTSVGGAILIWSTVEPTTYLISPPQHAAPFSPQAYEWSLAYLLMHWGPIMWATFTVSALTICYMLFIRKKFMFRLSSSLEVVLGSQTDGFIGKLIDTLFVVGIVFGIAINIVMMVPNLEAAVSTLFGVESSIALKLLFVFLGASVATVSVFLGLKKGIERLSTVNIWLLFVMVGAAFILGPKQQIVDSTVNALGRIMAYWPSMLLWTDPYTDGTFPQDWTMFYGFYFIAWCPFLALFIARVSRGRTVRQLLVGGTLGAAAGAVVIHSVFGSITLYLQNKGIVDLAGILEAQGGPMTTVTVLKSLPFGNFFLCVFAVFTLICLATMMDSACFVMAATTTRSLAPESEPSRALRLTWAIVMTLLAIGFLAVGGLSTAKIFSNFSGILMIPPSVLMVVCWFRIIKLRGKDLLNFNTEKDVDCK